MRIVKVEAFGGPESLRLIDEPDPDLGSGQLLVDVRAAGVNYADLMAREGKYRAFPTTPFYPGFEVSGVVDEVGPGVEGFKNGDRVAVLIPNHGYSSKAVVDAKTAFIIPDSIDFSVASALLVQGLTAYFLLEAGRLTSGNTVLVPSAAGGVGSLAVQIAKLKGAGKVIGLSSVTKHERVLKLGADSVYDYSRSGWANAISQEMDGRGVDVYLDSQGDLAGEGFDTLAYGSRWLIFGGQAEGSSGLPQERLGKIIGNNITLRGYNLYYNVGEFATGFAELLKWTLEGKLTVDVQTFTLADVQEAHRAIKDRKTSGKVVLVP